MAKSDSSRALDALLDEEGKPAEAVVAALRKVVHRTVLWRYRSGNGKPDAETIAKIERITNGRVPANGWEDSEEPKSERKPMRAKGRAS